MSSEGSSQKNEELQGPLQLFEGTVVDAPEFGSLRIRPNWVLAVDARGKIVAELGSSCESDKSEQQLSGSLRAAIEAARTDGRVVQLGPLQFLLPGLVDCHFHAAQYSYTGTGLDLPLMGSDGWLETYTFPTERLMVEDLNRARSQCKAVLRSTLRHGTTTALYFQSLHLEPAKILADVADQFGQRALIGKVCMDRNSPSNYVASTEQNIADSEAFIDYCETHRSSRISAVVTPRFVPTCSLELLRGLGQLASRRGCRVQTHATESVDEVAACKSLHPENPRDAALLDSCGLLLGPGRAVLAHGVHLSDEELQILAARGAAVAHCPLSNAYFAGSVFRTKDALRLGVRVGLATDVAGGYDPSMMSAMRSAVWVSKMLETGVGEYDFGSDRQPASSARPGELFKRRHPGAGLTVAEALWLATMGGAAALGLEDTIGSFEVGKEFDALIIDPASPDSRLDLFGQETTSGCFEKFFHNGDDRNITSVYVQGTCVLKRRTVSSGGCCWLHGDVKEQSAHDDQICSAAAAKRQRRG